MSSFRQFGKRDRDSKASSLSTREFTCNNAVIDHLKLNDLTISGENIIHMLFKNRPIPYVNVVSTDLSGVITADMVSNYRLINLEPSGASTDFAWELDSSVNSINSKLSLFSDVSSSLLVDFAIVNSVPSHNLSLKFNAGPTDTSLRGSGDMNTPGIIEWFGTDVSSNVGGAILSWDGNAWSVLDAFNFSSVKDGTGTTTIVP